MSYHRRRTRSPLGAITLPHRGSRGAAIVGTLGDLPIHDPRGSGGRTRSAVSALGALMMAGTGGSCPYCGSCGFDARNTLGTQETWHCPACGRWSPASAWGACDAAYPVYVGGGGRRGAWGRRGGGGRPRGGHGGGGHHPHHGFGDDTPPTVATGSPDEQVVLLRRVANAQEAFNAQDLTMRRYQLAATVAIPIAATAWSWIWDWFKKRRAR